MLKYRGNPCRDAVPAEERRGAKHKSSRFCPNFYTRVYDFVKQVPYGRVVSYGYVAAALGEPRAARAVGFALHMLPFKTDVPWHRVINSKGRISIRGDDFRADLQRRLLEAEGVKFDAGGKVELL